MTEKTLNIDPSKIHLNYIEEVLVSIDDSNEIIESNPSMAIDVAHITGHIVKENKILFGLKLVFSTPNIDSKNEGLNHECKFRYNFHFTVDNLNEMYQTDDKDNIIFKKTFIATLAGISYSTLRGIIFEKTSKSNWTSLLLPVIDPSLLLESWITQD